MNAILQASALGKAVSAGKEGPQHILRQVDLSIGKGEYVAVMGPSGSGKTTLLYTVSGMDSPTSGRVLLGGWDLSTLNQAALSRLRLERMGFVFQQHNLLKNLSLFDNIILSARRLGKESPKRINQRARELMELTGTLGLEDRNITQASGGQLQRIAICRALINKPEILFGDEPTGALNSRATGEILDILQGIHQKGTTILLATHDPRVAARSQRVIYMTDGSIAAEKRMGTFEGREGEPLNREQELTAWLARLGF